MDGRRWMMAEVQREEWMARVQQTFARLRFAARDAQDAACEEMEDYSDEAAAKLREMFEGERARLAAEAVRRRAEISAGKPKPWPAWRRPLNPKAAAAKPKPSGETKPRDEEFEPEVEEVVEAEHIEERKELTCSPTCPHS
jgi:hypothetical protein